MTAVQEKNVRFPTDARTLKRYLTNVVDFAESQPVVPRSMRELGLLATLQECVSTWRCSCEW